MKRKISLLLALLMMASVSCSSTDAPESIDTSAAVQTPSESSSLEETAAVEEIIPSVPDYDYGGKDFDGYEFRIMNYESYCDTSLRIDPDEQIGESLNDIIYDRNLKVEDDLNFVLNEIKEPYTGWVTSQVALCDKVINSVTADDGAYDAAYLPVSFKASVITDGYLLNLNEMDGLNVYEYYWDTVLNQDMTIDGKLYTASSPLNLSSICLSDVLLFNEGMLKNLNLELPYDLVRNGAWTLDRLYEYVEKTVNLNGATDFTYRQDAKTIYSIAGHSDKPYALLNGAGCFLVKKEGEEVVLGIGEEHLINAAESIARILRASVGYVHFNNSSGEGGYVNLFASERAAFITCELKTVNVLRDMDASFGLLPMPKYDEAQESYHTSVADTGLFLTVPKTQRDSERAAMILDSMSYYSNRDVLPIYYNETVSHKGLRNEDSVEMLDIIYNTRGIEFSQIFSITKDWVNAFNSQIVNENLNLASTNASSTKIININMKKIFKALAD